MWIVQFNACRVCFHQALLAEKSALEQQLDQFIVIVAALEKELEQNSSHLQHLKTARAQTENRFKV
jgi:hypothetical protein